MFKISSSKSGLLSIGSQRVGHDWNNLAYTRTHTHTHTHTSPNWDNYHLSSSKNGISYQEDFRVFEHKPPIPLAWPWNIPFSAPNSDILVCLASLCMWKVKVKSLRCVQLFGIPWTVAYQAPPSMGFPRQEYWSGLPLPSPGDLPKPGTKSGSPTL